MVAGAIVAVAVVVAVQAIVGSVHLLMHKRLLNLQVSTFFTEFKSSTDFFYQKSGIYILLQSIVISL